MGRKYTWAFIDTNAAATATSPEGGEGAVQVQDTDGTFTGSDKLRFMTASVSPSQLIVTGSVYTTGDYAITGNVYTTGDYAITGNVYTTGDYAITGNVYTTCYNRSPQCYWRH